jgi:hypothetical protein
MTDKHVDYSFVPILQCTFALPRVVPFSIYGCYYAEPLDWEFTSACGGRTWQAGLRVQVEI